MKLTPPRNWSNQFFDDQLIENIYKISRLLLSLFVSQSHYSDCTSATAMCIALYSAAWVPKLRI